MRKILKKIISYLLIICMVLPVVPMQAFAAEGLSITGGIEEVDYTKSGDVITIKTDKSITISGVSTIQRIEVESNVTSNVTLNSVDINVINASPVKINSGATLNLTIEGNNVLIGKSSFSDVDYSAITVSAGTTLNISGNGSLDAKSMWDYNGEERVGFSAGIGSNKSSDEFEAAGKITINSGTIKTTGEIGIGGNSADITINNGTITTENVAQIGIGGKDTKVEIVNGDVNVGGKLVNYDGQTYTLYTSYAIGGENSTVNIKGGTVTAKGARDVAIGG